MTDITPLTAIQNLTQISREIDTAGEQLAFWEKKAVEKRETYLVAFNTEYLKSQGSIPERKAIAENATHGERISAEMAEAEVRIWRSKIRILERRIEVGRSTVGVLRAEMNL